MNIKGVILASICLSCFAVTTRSIARSERPGGAAYVSLWLYDGSWQLVPAAAHSETVRIDNHCHFFGAYFACQQTVNGKAGALLVFVRAEKPGHYYSQVISPDDKANGRGDLEIDGDRWTYLGKDESASKVTYHRTTNTFSGDDRIHYELSESTDGTHWTVTGSGDERRVTGASR